MISSVGVTSLQYEELTPQSPMPIFSTIKLQLGLYGTTENLYVNENNEYVGNQNISGVTGNLSVDYNLLSTGVQPFEVIASPTTQSSSQVRNE